MRKIVSALACALLLTIGAAVANPTPAAAADPGAEAAFVSRINSVRASKGLAPLQVYGELVGIARGWSDQMAAAGGISHNPNLSGQVSAPWQKLGENVGVGQSVDELMNAFVNSAAHYKNIVDPSYNYIGVGVSYGDDGRMYTTHNFMYMPDGGGASEAPAPDPTPAPAPPPAPTPRASRATAPPPAPEPEAEAAPAPAPPPPPPVPTAAPQRVVVVLQALRVAES